MATAASASQQPASAITALQTSKKNIAAGDKEPTQNAHFWNQTNLASFFCFAKEFPAFTGTNEKRSIQGWQGWGKEQRAQG